jgi:hypothetical protein
MSPIELPLEKTFLVSKLTDSTPRSRSAQAFRELLGRPPVVLTSGLSWPLRPRPQLAT